MFQNDCENTKASSECNQIERASKTTITIECDLSAIGQHVLRNDECAANYTEDQLSILDTACSPFHLSLLEDSYIRAEMFRSRRRSQANFSGAGLDSELSLTSKVE